MDWPGIRTRIGELMDRAGVKRAQLADAIGYDRSMITHVLKGTRGLGPAGLSNLARFFDVPLLSLVQGPLPEDIPLTQFKDEDRAVFPPALYPRAKGYAFRFADVYSLLFREPADLTAYRGRAENPMTRGEHAAQAFREQHHNATSPITSLVELLEGIGVAVAEVDDERHLLREVVFRWKPSLSLIVVRRDLHVETKRFLLAHALGHLVLEDMHGAVERNLPRRKEGTHGDIFSSDPHEKAANTFAARLLLPDAALEPMIRGRGRLASGDPVPVWADVISHLKQEYGVSAELVFWRLSQAGMFSQQLAQNYKERSLYKHTCSTLPPNPMFEPAEEMTRLSVRGFTPSARYRRWVNLLADQDRIDEHERDHLLELGFAMEAA